MAPAGEKQRDGKITDRESEIDRQRERDRETQRDKETDRYIYTGFYCLAHHVWLLCVRNRQKEIELKLENFNTQG